MLYGGGEGRVGAGRPRRRQVLSMCPSQRQGLGEEPQKLGYRYPESVHHRAGQRKN